MDIVTKRLFNQHLIGRKFTTPEEVVSWLGAVQAQDYPAAKWAVGLRLKDATDAKVEDAVNAGKILRTHIMRPTWHFVKPEDLVWIQKLTSPNVKKLMGHYNRKLELTEKVFAKSTKAISKALRNNQYCTRQELKKLLADIGIMTDVQRLAHLIMWAELDGLICSGPRKGKQFTYALVEDRVKKNKILDREESLATLATLYFQSHGPAQRRDFAWWSGLSMKDATEAVSLIKTKLTPEEIDNKTYYSMQSTQIQTEKSKAFLLSIYDEYTIAYKDRHDLSEKNDIERMITMGNALTAVLILNGKVAGTWKRKLKQNTVAVTISPFRTLNNKENEAIEKEVAAFGKFLGLTATIAR